MGLTNGWGTAAGALAILMAGAASAQVAGEYVPGETNAQFNASALVRSGLFARTTDVSVDQRPHPEYQAQGALLGAFRLDAALRAGLAYDDDILAQPGSPSDEIAQFEPSMQLQSNWSRHYASIFARASENLFTERSDQTTLDYAVGSNDRIDLGRDMMIALGGSYERATDLRTDLGSPQNAAKPVRYDRARAYLGGVKQFNRLRLSLDADLQDDSYNNARTSTGVSIYQRDRDETIGTLSARAEYAINAGVSVYVSAAGNTRSFRNELPGEFSRNSSGYDVAVGSNFDLTHLLRGELEVGYINQNFRNSAFPTVDGVSLRGSLQYFFSPLTTFTVTSTQTVGNSDIVGSAGYLQTIEQLTVDHELRRNVILSLRGGNEDDAIRGIDRHDERPYVGVSAKYLLNQSLGVVGGYDFYRDSSTGALRGPSYNINRVFVSFIYQL